MQTWGEGGKVYQNELYYKKQIWRISSSYVCLWDGMTEEPVAMGSWK